MFKWSRITHTPLARAAIQQILDNVCEFQLSYHNVNHVIAMYQYLADTNEPYDEVLDWAVLFHDIVYDEKPEKELRSMKMFANMIEHYEGCTPDMWEQARIGHLIMHTINHTVHSDQFGSSAIIRADLHGLTNRATAFINFGKIMEESLTLYGIDEITFAKNTEQFMRGLSERVWSNITSDPEHAEFYRKVIDGIWFTIDLSKLIQGLT